MVTATKVAAKSVTRTRVTSTTIREYAKKDHSPKWDNTAAMSGTEFAAHFRAAMNFYNLNHSGKDLKPRVIDWMGRNDYIKKDIAAFKATKDWRCSLATGSVASCLLRGMPISHPGFNHGRSFVEWLRKDISEIIESGKNDIAEVEVNKTAKVVAPVLNIQDRIREQAGMMSEEIDLAIDAWITDPEAFDPKAFKMVIIWLHFSV